MVSFTQPAYSRPVLVELFTSQGCSSCPPADALLAKLRERDDVIALSYHVDYWDRLGWKDPYGLPEATRRQSEYNLINFGRRGNYTPQMVIDGFAHEVGSAKSRVELLITRAKRQTRNSWRDIPITFEDNSEQTLTVTIGEGKGETQNRPLDIVGIVYNDEAYTKVTAGENRSRHLMNHNIVRQIHHLGQWNGDVVDITLKKDAFNDGENLVIFLQEEGARNISGIGTMRLAAK